MFSCNAFGKSHHDLFQVSCAANYFIGITNLLNHKINRKLVEADAVMLCSKEKTPTEKPMLNGCLKAVQLIFSADMNEYFRQEQIARLNRSLCESLGNR